MTTVLAQNNVICSVCSPLLDGGTESNENSCSPPYFLFKLRKYCEFQWIIITSKMDTVAQLCKFKVDWLMMFNATFHNISVTCTGISWRSYFKPKKYFCLFSAKKKWWCQYNVLLHGGKWFQSRFLKTCLIYS